jgi:site-specific DNA-cytosine methylase
VRDERPTAGGDVNELALFAGAGGGILGGHLLGWRTVCAVERDAYAAQVLAQRQNDGCLRPFPIWSDVCSFDGRPWRGIVDVVSGGFPCQDISAAGYGAGITGSRSGLWKEFGRIIREVRPGRVYVENSPILTSRGLGVVLGDLAEMGFDCEWGVVSAADSGAPHLRERIWIMADAYCPRKSQQTWSKQDKLWPTPTTMKATGGAALCKWGGAGARKKMSTMVSHAEMNGPLNPPWVEWLMGWPIGWTDLMPLETARFREWRQQHSIFSATESKEKP